ncbi:MAG: preprotein translocase subunit SecE [Chloroflexi bacterium]|nr:preprotein translocase subunit SecE [Chloroflexota bacterium]
MPRWISDIVSELRKVTWPSRQEVGYLTVVVIVVSAFFGAILGVADIGFSWIIENTVLS